MSGKLETLMKPLLEGFDIYEGNKVIVIAPTDNTYKRVTYYALVHTATPCGGGHQVFVVSAPPNMSKEEVEKEVKRILVQNSEPPYGYNDCNGFEMFLEGLLTEYELVELVKNYVFNKNK